MEFLMRRIRYADDNYDDFSYEGRDITVLIVDDHAILRESLRTALNSFFKIRVVGTAEDAQEALEMAKATLPDIVIMDLKLPGKGMDGIECIKRLVKEVPMTKVVALTAYSDRMLVLEALKAGAKAFVLKTISPEGLVRVLRRVFKGETWIDPKVAHMVAEELREADPKVREEEAKEFTDEERELLRLIAVGYTNEQIALHFGISKESAKWRLRKLFRKMGVKTRTEAAARAAQLGLLKLK